MKYNSYVSKCTQWRKLVVPRNFVKPSGNLWLDNFGEFRNMRKFVKAKSSQLGGIDDFSGENHATYLISFGPNNVLTDWTIWRRLCKLFRYVVKTRQFTVAYAQALAGGSDRGWTGQEKTDWE